MKVCTLIYKRNYKEEIIYHIQETKTAFEKFFMLINTKGKRNVFSIFYGYKII